VTDCENLNHPLFSVDLVGDAKLSHLVFPQPGQFAKQAAEKGSPAIACQWQAL
jgi:hypothetical protein